MSAIPSRVRPWAAAVVLILVATLSGCATTNARDPLEPFNRTVYSFNEVVDDVFLRPLAQGYRAVLPQFAQTGIRNFFSNLDDITVLINNLLQFKVPQATSDLGRFLINSTIGVLGFFDVATPLGIEKHNEDFGQTLGYWGIDTGPYLVLPFLGPSSVRDGIGRLVDKQTDVIWYIEDISTRNILLGTRIVSLRAQLLDSEKILETAALDPYSFIREAYFQRRRSLVYDGNPPPEPEEDYNAPSKPMTETAPSVTILVDRYGNVVSGAVGEIPLGPAPEVAKTPSKSQPAGADQMPAAAREQPSSKSAPAHSSSLGEEDRARQPQIVRVWLSGFAASR